MCPFEELGCKFLHVFARNCRFGQRCNKWLSPRRHVDTEIEMVEEQCSKNGEDSETVDDNESFVTSTPQKSKFQCEECENKTQCTDCSVRDYVGTGNMASYRKHKVHFKDISRENY